MAPYVESQTSQSPTSQLEDELHDHLRSSLATPPTARRPVLHHLNADTSWLLQLPRPTSAIRRGGRVYYNILIDPWLSGPQSDVASWFSQQWHAIEPAVKGIDGVTRLIWDIEDVASRDIEAERENLKQANGKRKRISADVGGRKSKRHSNGANGHIQQEKEDSKNGSRGMCIDAVAVSHEFTDHCHKDTLLEIERDVPVFATTKAASLIRSWNHFHSVIETPVFSSPRSDWRQVSVPPLPEWLSISRLVEKQDALYYHSALMIAFNLDASPVDKVNDRTSSDGAECIIYTPHGIPYAALSPLSNASPSIQTLAFLHGLHDVAIS
ncbi:hypothetical protein LTS18_001751, partial [Coniosporium uncinatum]